MSAVSSVGVVVIGRNEGERLKRCLRSLQAVMDRLVYVDSGSTDDSVTFAKEIGATVVNLDTTRKFTMARARNAGYRELMANHPDVKYVQFVDGDCLVIDGWIPAGAALLDANPSVGIVCGYRHEMFPRASIYNSLLDIEWRGGGSGDITACSGDMMVRATLYGKLDGLRDTMIAAEDTEFCVRARQQGWLIHRLNRPMTLHDGNMTRFGQWWTRSKRSGHGFAEQYALHGASPERWARREYISNWLWGLAFPLLVCLLAPFSLTAALVLTLVYIVWMVRIARQYTKFGWTTAGAFGVFTMLGKTPMAFGQLNYWRDHLRKRPSELMEYK